MSFATIAILFALAAVVLAIGYGAYELSHD